MFLFYTWITNNSNKALVFSGLALGIGILGEISNVSCSVSDGL